MADPDVGEGAAHHDLVVAAPGAVGVVFRGRNLVVAQVDAGGGGRLDRAGRGNVVGGDRVAEDAEDASLHDVRYRLGLHPHVLEIGRVLPVGRPRIPVVGLAGGALAPIPGLVSSQ